MSKFATRLAAIEEALQAAEAKVSELTEQRRAALWADRDKEAHRLLGLIDEQKAAMLTLRDKAGVLKAELEKETEAQRIRTQLNRI